MSQGQVFAYFDELRRLIEAAHSDLFFVDLYLDADFVPEYLPQVSKGAAVRLLGHRKMGTLLPAVDLFVQQSGSAVAVRSSSKLHDRYLFLDRTACCLSGAFFKDGLKNATAVLTQITDAFQAMSDTYGQQWSVAKVERR